MSKEKYNFLKFFDDYHLVNIFNRETSHNGWGSERGRFLIALQEAFEHKAISLEHNSFLIIYSLYLPLLSMISISSSVKLYNW